MASTVELPLGVAEAITDLLTPDGTWWKDALCPEVDFDLHFPEKGGSTRDAKRVCLACGVRPECLAYALKHDERHGIWGGMSERERHKLKRGTDAPPQADSSSDTAADTELWTTGQACEYLEIPADRNAAAKLRERGLTPAGSQGKQRLWDAEQVRQAPPARPQGRPPADTDYDEALVLRMVAGEPLPGQNAAVRGAKIEAVRRLAEAGHSARVIAPRVGYHDRYVQQLMNQLGIAPARSA